MVLLRSLAEARIAMRAVEDKLFAQPGVIGLRAEENRGQYVLVVNIDKEKDCKVLRENIRKICKVYPIEIRSDEKFKIL